MRPSLLFCVYNINKYSKSVSEILNIVFSFFYLFNVIFVHSTSHGQEAEWLNLLKLVSVSSLSCKIIDFVSLKVAINLILRFIPNIDEWLVPHV